MKLPIDLSSGPLRRALSQLLREPRCMKGFGNPWQEQEFYGQIQASLQEEPWTITSGRC